jgi:retinol dehydrogenase-12
MLSALSKVPLLGMLVPMVDPNMYCPQALLEKDLNGITVLITGGNSGFGKMVAAQLCQQGADVVIAVRRLELGKEVANELSALPSSRGSCTAEYVDLASLESVRKFAAEFQAKHSTLHILIENAAVCCVANTPLPASGFEPHLGINHYGHFLLRELLTPLLAASKPSRVVVLGSSLHDRLFDYRPTSLDLSAEDDAAYLGWTRAEKLGMLEQWMAYARSKLANVLSALAAAPRLSAQGIQCVSVHPGLDTSTGLFRAQPIGAAIMGKVFPSLLGVQTTWQSIQTILFCALEDHDQLEPGAFYAQYYKAKFRDGSTGGWPLRSPNPIVNPTDAAKLERISYVAVGLRKPSLRPEADSMPLDVPLETPTTEEAMRQ